ncbi:DUF1559 domain-containing protein [Schlesneria sp. T3-172]|uniref:DUF1559 family PulG-like putative transporter n=1 Tax=Schlesneria sphaerica TaxID=3373610 RepID=UPI0037C54443
MWQKRISIAVVVLMFGLIASVSLPMIVTMREQARRMQSKNKLKQFGLALYNYSDAFGGLPTGGIFNQEGVAYHGWMTFILPYLSASPFYIYVDDKEPWDSPENAGMFLNANPDFENPSEPTVRRYWEFPVAHYSANAHLMASSSSVKFRDIAQADKTFLVGEIGGDFIPWGCPYNWRELETINAKPATYGRSSQDGCQFLFVDGHVEFVSNEVSVDVLNVIRGKDLAGFHENRLKIQRPSAFPCPDDALFFSWSSHHGNLTVVRTDKNGIAKHGQHR